jgi:hypothetical protein
MAAPTLLEVDATLAVYPLKLVRLPRDVSAHAHPRFCRHRVVVKQCMMPPDLFRRGKALQTSSKLPTLGARTTLKASDRCDLFNRSPA